MLSNVNDYIIPGLILIILLLVITLIVGVIRLIIPMRERINELSRITFTLLKKDQAQDDSLEGIKKALFTIHENIGSLSTSTKRVIEDFNTVRDQSILPTPQLSNMIKETITEQITIETLLSHDMKLPNKKSTEYIIENTAKTYPHVDQKYIVKLCMAMIENFNISQQENQQKQKEQ